ncbi:type II toxin-antitoxin system prevent-host-death family antitoxin [Candidatus Magnetomonas plexicatena]|uniref:type II toxin-antitoxin system prevent-host-death family antitoxin n=1 Tax=Candidatus Magnetomonas plexicatena TaxID=2552947 RepID=UPI00110355A5|nr:type II toxin-antitoxin system prevent-host-death family antitoxin [Nitrospirales bacterium LBB_01]
MLRKISAMTARRQFGQIMNEVSLKEDDYIIERAGKPLVAIVAIDKYEWMRQEKERARNKFFKMVDEIRETTKDIPLDVIETAVDEAIKAVRKEEINAA